MKKFLFGISLFLFIGACSKKTEKPCGEVTSVEWYEINETDKIVMTIVIQYPAPIYQEKFIFIENRDKLKWWQDELEISPSVTLCPDDLRYHLLRQKADN